MLAAPGNSAVVQPSVCNGSVELRETEQSRKWIKTCPDLLTDPLEVEIKEGGKSPSGKLTLKAKNSELFVASFPGGALVKNPPAKAGDTRDVGSIPGLGRSPGEGNGSPLQCSCLGIPLDLGVWWAQSMGSRRIGDD